MRPYNLSKYPLRGIIAEIAREKGITRQAVRNAYQRGNPDILRRMAEKAIERYAKVAQYKRVLV